MGMGVIPRSGAAQPCGQNKGICSNFTLAHARSSLLNSVGQVCTTAPRRLARVRAVAKGGQKSEHDGRVKDTYDIPKFLILKLAF